MKKKQPNIKRRINNNKKLNKKKRNSIQWWITWQQLKKLNSNHIKKKCNKRQILKNQKQKSKGKNMKK